MRKSTIVVAFLAASVASASAAPSSSQNLRSGTSFQSGSNQAAAQAAPVARPFGASGYVSVRSAQARPGVPAPAPRPAMRQPRVASAAADRSARVERERGETRRFASSRTLSSRNRAVALSREMPMARVTRPSEAPTAGAPRGSIQSMVTAEAQRAGVAPSLGHAVVKVESMYNPRATGKGGYIGLMQLSYQTAKGMGYRGSRAGLYEPSTNLRYGMRYLAQANAKAGGSTCGAVSKYQGGHAVKGVTRAGAVYCGKVRRYMAAR